VDLVSDDMLRVLLETGDIQRGQVPSALHSRFIDQIAERALGVASGPEKKRPYIAEQLNDIGIDADTKNFSFDLYRGRYLNIGNPSRDKEKFLKYAVSKGVLNNSDYTFLMWNINEGILNIGSSMQRECPTEICIEYEEADDENITEFEKTFGTFTQWEKAKNISLENILTDLLKEKQKEYLDILDKEFDYLNSDEAVKESIEANEYEFDENGDIA
jgi:hypothetical protein